MENTPLKAFQVPPIPRGIGTATYVLYYNPLLKRITYGLPGTAYTLPTASGSTLGGVKIGTGLSIDVDGVLSATGSYTLPIASSTILGGIKIGSGLSIDPSTGIVTAAGTYSLPIATASILGGIKVGTGLSINSTTGVLDATYSYSLPTASASVLGGIKVGTGLSIDGSGVLSATGGSYSLPIASATVLGGIKVGTNLSIDPVTGILSATGGGTTYTFSEGLTESSGAVKLGSASNSANPLTTNRFINTGANTLRVRGSSGNYTLQVENVGAGYAATFETGTGPAARFFNAPATTNSIASVLEISRASTGTAAAGIGAQIDFYLQTVASGSANSGGIGNYWTDANNATRSSAFKFTTINSTVTTVGMILTPEGTMQLKQVTTIPTPPTGYGAIGAKTDGNLYYKKPDGTEIQLN